MQLLQIGPHFKVKKVWFCKEIWNPHLDYLKNTLTGMLGEVGILSSLKLHLTYTCGIFEQQIWLKKEEEKDKLVFGWKIEEGASIWITGREIFLSKQPMSSNQNSASICKLESKALILNRVVLQVLLHNLISDESFVVRENMFRNHVRYTWLGALSKERAVSARRVHYPAPKQTARLGSRDAKDGL